MPPKKFLIVFGLLLLLIPLIALVIHNKTSTPYNTHPQNAQDLNVFRGTITKIEGSNITIKSKSPDKTYTFNIKPSIPIDVQSMDPTDKTTKINPRDLKIGEAIIVFTKQNSEIAGVSLITSYIAGTIANISGSSLSLNIIDNTGEPPFPGKEKFRLVKVEITSDTQVVGDLKKDQRATVTSHQDATSDTFTAIKVIVSEPLATPPGQLAP